MLKNLISKYLVLKILLAVFLLILGNLFWYILVANLSNAHLLTSSSVQIVLELIFPIAIFSTYLTCLIIFSIFVKDYLIRLLVIFLSMADYFFLTGSGYVNLLGEIAI